MVRTRFEGDVRGSTACPVPGCRERIDFGMRLTGLPVPTLADDLAVIYQHATDAWIGVRAGLTKPCQFQRAGHERMIGSGECGRGG
jgi:hypothetical protein